MSPEEEQKDVKKQGDKEAQDIADQLLADLLGNAPPAKKLETKPVLAKHDKPAEPAPPKAQPAEAPKPKPVEATLAPVETKSPAPKPATPAPTPTAAPVAKSAPVPAPAPTPKPEHKPEVVTPEPAEPKPVLAPKPAPAPVAKPAEPAPAPKTTPLETQPPAPKPEHKPELPVPKPAAKPVEVEEEEIEVPVQEDEVAPEEPLTIGGSVEFNPHVKKPRPQKKPEEKVQVKPSPKAHVHPMKEIGVAKVTINIGVGEAGEKILKAEKVLEMITKQKPVRTYSKTTNKDLGIRKDQEIGCKVTLRGAKAEDFLAQAFWVRENRIFKYSFDREGNFSFGIPDYTDFKGMKYDPDIGIFGMDISAQLKRKGGTRIKNRKIMKRHIPSKHRITHGEGVEFAKERFQLEVLE